jgi:Kef-type K+ transport system membrane component KefB
MEAFPHWIIVLIVVIVLTKIGRLLARRLDIPTVTVQLLIGVLLGPSLLNLLGAPIILGTWGSPSPGPLHDVLKILAEIGLVQLMFLAGLEVDWQELKKFLKSSFSVAALGFGLTVVSVAILTRLFVDRWAEALAMSAIMAASGFGISVYSFSEKKVLGSQVAAIVSGTATSSSLSAILLMIASQATNYGATYGVFKMAIAVSWFLAKLIMFFAVVYFLTSRYLTLVAKTGFRRNVPRPALEGIGGVEGHNLEESYLTGKPPASLSRPNGMAGELPKRPRQMLIGYLLLVASLYAWAAMHFGSFSAVGVASLGGALLGISNLEVKEKIVKGFGSILASIPMGILFIAIGMEVNLGVVEGAAIFLGVMLAAAIGAKVIGCWIATNKGYQSSRERVLIIFGVLAQGEMGILIAAYLFSRGVLSPPSFSVGIIAVVSLTIVSPVLIRIASSGFGIQTTCARVAGPGRSDSFSQNP